MQAVRLLLILAAALLLAGTETRQLQASLGSGVASLNAAGSLAPASTEITLDTFRADNAQAKTLGPLLENGQPYRVTVIGTFNKSAAGDWKVGACGGTPESGPMFPSPGTVNGQVGRDAEWKFAVAEGDSDCVSPHPEFRISVDGGASFQSLPANDIGAAPNPQHEYHYTVTGQGQIVGFLLNDSTGTNNNYGVLRITISAPVVDGVEFTQAIQELQTVEELQADLAGDGKPPVPIVAGKPLAMRVYFNEVDSAQSFTVEVTGEVNQEIDITLTPGCTASDRRKGANNCESADFYFTPLEGPWSVQLVVKDFADEVVLDETFNLFSLKTDDVTLKAVSVCDAEGGPGFAWECQDAFPLINDVSLMRRMFPTADVKVIVTGDVIRRNESTFAETIFWWGKVNRDLDALYVANGDAVFQQVGTEIYYFGLVRDALPGNSAGTAYVDTRGAASRPGLPSTVAHEVGHAMGLDHTDTSVPAYVGDFGCSRGERDTLPPWPYADNRLRSGGAPGQIEVGFDVASGTPLNGEFFFDVMGYCSSTPPPIAPDITRWISPFNTFELISPAGPLSVAPVSAMAAPASVPGDFWLVQGVLDSIPQDLALDPLVTLELEGSVGPGTGTHRIEVHGGSGLLFTRMFTPAHGHGSPSPGNPVVSTGSAFSELIPVQANATSIQIFDAQQAQIGAITLGGAAPVVDSITLPASFAGQQAISWSVSDPDSAQHTYWVDYSPDGGQTWHSQAMGLTEATLMLNFDLLAASDGQGVFRVIASDGVNSSSAISAPFAIAGKAPQGEITGPSATSFRLSDLVWLEAAAWDIDDGTLDDGAVTWSSSLDGALGTGASLPVYDLSAGSHTITMTASDSDNNIVTDTITITVFDAPIVEGDSTTNIDCIGGVNALDALALLMHLSGLDAGSCQTIGSGAPLFGDADCNGVVALPDVAELLALAADLPGGCA